MRSATGPGRAKRRRCRRSERKSARRPARRTPDLPAPTREPAVCPHHDVALLHSIIHCRCSGEGRVVWEPAAAGRSPERVAPHANVTLRTLFLVGHGRLPFVTRQPGGEARPCLAHYRAIFRRADGTVRYDADGSGPLDVNNFAPDGDYARAVPTRQLVGSRRPGARRRHSQRLWNSATASFAYRRQRHGIDRSSIRRWTQIWMMHALALRLAPA